MKKRHDREVLTNYVGELFQHDTSIHQWSPYAEKRWSLITTLDDYSRMIVYGDLWEKESSWSHIESVKYVVNCNGCPLSYYVDNHSIFRYVERRDSCHYRLLMKEEEAVVQWKEVLKDLGIEVHYAMSPAAKGKVERPYRWLQDHMVRRCAEEKVKMIDEAREILYEEIHRYNYKHVHSTTGEIPVVRYEKALENNQNLLRPFLLRAPFETPDDIFCYRFKRHVDPYHKVSFHHLRFAVHGVPLRSEVELRVSFNLKRSLALIRIWYAGRCVGEQRVKHEDVKIEL